MIIQLYIRVDNDNHKIIKAQFCGEGGLIPKTLPVTDSGGARNNEIDFLDIKPSISSGTNNMTGPTV